MAGGEAIYFEPGDWQLGYNDGDREVRALLVGSPKELSPVEAYLDCPECGEETRFAVQSDAQTSGEQTRDRAVCIQCGSVPDRDP